MITHEQAQDIIGGIIRRKNGEPNLHYIGAALVAEAVNEVLGDRREMTEVGATPEMQTAWDAWEPDPPLSTSHTVFDAAKQSFMAGFQAARREVTDADIRRALEIWFEVPEHNGSFAQPHWDRMRAVLSNRAAQPITEAAWNETVRDALYALIAEIMVLNPGHQPALGRLTSKVEAAFRTGDPT